jgi:hypothetical protein
LAHIDGEVEEFQEFPKPPGPIRRDDLPLPPVLDVCD